MLEYYRTQIWRTTYEYISAPSKNKSQRTFFSGVKRTVLTETGGQTVAGGSAHHCTSLLWRGEAAENLCQISSCTTDCNYLAWFWPGLAFRYCVPTHRPVPSACCHQPITQCPVPSGGLTWGPTGFHPAQRTGLCQQLKMCSGVHHQLPEVITNFTITNSTHSTVSQ